MGIGIDIDVTTENFTQFGDNDAQRLELVKLLLAGADIIVSVCSDLPANTLLRYNSRLDIYEPLTLGE